MNWPTVTIEKIINRGFGLARMGDGRAVLVPLVLPGEKVAILGTRTQKKTLFATRIEINSPHQQRVLPPCPYYGRCGGCNLQHALYDLQLEIKRDILADLGSRSQCLPLAAACRDVALPLPSPQQLHYRQRIRLRLDGDGNPGFLHFQSHRLVAIQQCLLAHPMINSCLQSVIHFQDAPDLLRAAAAMELLFNPASGKVLVLLHLADKPRANIQRLADDLAESSPEIEAVFFQGPGFSLMGPYGKPGTPHDCRLEVTYTDVMAGEPPLVLTWEVGGFCQVNLEQNGRMINTVLQLVQVQPEDRILDLFCGMGNFSLPLARLAKSVSGYEGQGSAIRSARRNSESAGLTTTVFTKGPVHQCCQKLLQQGERFEVTVIDPPRQGIPGLAPTLATLTRRHLVYISCDPATLCRDLASLIDSGFSLEAVQPIDMFPQTHHLETVVLLKRL